MIWLIVLGVAVLIGVVCSNILLSEYSWVPAWLGEVSFYGVILSYIVVFCTLIAAAFYYFAVILTWLLSMAGS